MSIDAFTYRSLTKAVQNIKPAPKFFTDTFARAGMALPTTVTEIRKLSGTVKKAPLSERGAEAKEIGHRGTTMDIVSFPHIRMKSKFDMGLLQALDISQANIYANFNPKTLLTRKIARQLAELKDKCVYTIEWMYMKMVVTGAISYDDSEGCQVTVNYNRDSDSAKSASVDWDETTADPFYDLDVIDLYLQTVNGAPADTYIFGTSAWQNYKNNTRVTTGLDNRRMEIGSIGGSDLYLRGYYYNKPIYVYGAVDDDGSTPLLPANGVLAFNKSLLDFWHDYGVCTEVTGDINPVADFVSKSYDVQDPAAKYILVETNPLPMCSNIDGVVYMNTKVS